MAWHLSKYNIMTKIPGENSAIIANLFRGGFGVYSPMECYLLSVVEELDEGHPILKRFAERGLIVNYDETEALEALARLECGRGTVNLTICPTMGCNFDCPYCFENHRSGVMSKEVQLEVVALAEKMLKASRADGLYVTWFGGEPLLAPAVIENLSQAFLALAEKYGLSYDAKIITNGYLLTRENVDLLYRCKVSTAQITLDGIGEAHNKTRHLAGGGDTFRQIISNLSENILPFPVNIRHNVHAGNIDEITRLKEFVGDLATKSRNRLHYSPSLVIDAEAAEARGSDVRTLCAEEMTDEEFMKRQAKLTPGRGLYCGANRQFSAVIDEKGRLYSCWDIVGRSEYEYGGCGTWDPREPIRSAEEPDNLTCFLNTASPFRDPECRECVWLPACAGGCPRKRLQGHRQCFPFKDRPTEYLLVLYEQMQREKGGRLETGVGHLYISRPEKMKGMLDTLKGREEKIQKRLKTETDREKVTRRILTGMIPEELRDGFSLPEDLRELCEYLLTLRGDDPEDRGRKPFCEGARLYLFLTDGAPLPCSREGFLSLWETATRSEPRYPGELPAHFRKSGDHVPFVHNDEGEVPPGSETFAPERIPEGMDAMLAFMDGNDLPPEIRAICAHYQLMHIHPFPDGNGHTARMLMLGMLSGHYSVPTLLNFYRLLSGDSARAAIHRYMTRMWQMGDMDDATESLLSLLMEAQYRTLRDSEAAG